MRLNHFTASCILLAALQAPVLPQQAGGSDDWKPAPGPLFTRWSQTIDVRHVLAEYPRPQLQREQWQNLNGLWNYAITARGAERPSEFDGRILVPFAVESALSGVSKKVGAEQELWYRRTFTTQRPSGLPANGRLRLNFGAVDWRATVWVNGRELGTHQGGYDPFSFDITGALQSDGEQELLVRVWDPTDDGFQPRGKQVKDPQGIWYTSVTGIWQTVWLEWVPQNAIARLDITTRVNEPAVQVRVATSDGTESGDAWLEVLDGDRLVGRAEGRAATVLTVSIPDAKLWSPASPFLYTLRAGLCSSDGEDRVTSYAGLREIAVRRDDAGRNRLWLNGEPLFQFGPLDQGWWPDGLYTAPSDEALLYDLEVTKKLGFNMVRKHVKVEPDRWYYHCDRLGLLVWQDMPNGDRHIRADEPDIERSQESADNFFAEWGATMTSLHNHPCIVVWVPFNEGWGQFDTNRVLAWTKERDPLRLVDGPSGWTDRSEGDMVDLHRYPGPGMPALEAKRAAVLGEFGGLGLPLEGHLWWNKRNWGYRTYSTREELQLQYESLIRRLKPLIGRGLAAAVYTQTTDVEGEVNGLLTYDRKQWKLDADRITPLHAELYEPQTPVRLDALLPTSERSPRVWRFTTNEPAKTWTQPDFNDQLWNRGPAGFGEPSTPGSVVRTPWHSPDIWLRHEFQARRSEGTVYLRIHHDEDAEIYLNGTHIASVSGYVTEYTDLELGDEARQALREGKNVLAVHCHQTGGGQYIDLGLQIARPLPGKP